MASAKRIDYPLIIITTLLVVFGIIVLASASVSISQIKFGSSYYLLNHQMLFALIPGVLLAFFFSKIKLSLLKKWAPVFLLINLLLMTFVFLPYSKGFERKSNCFFSDSCSNWSAFSFSI